MTTREEAVEDLIDALRDWKISKRSVMKIAEDMMTDSGSNPSAEEITEAEDLFSACIIKEERVMEASDTLDAIDSIELNEEVKQALEDL